MATISNDTSNTIITGMADIDSIRNFGASVTIDAGDGNDAISNSANNVTINAGSGHDSINNFGNSVTINANVGFDYINNRGSNVAIDAGSGWDYIYNIGSSVTIDAIAGDDTISNSGDNVIINAGEEFDFDHVYNIGSNVTINAGGSCNGISNFGCNVKITTGNGNDGIYNNDNDYNGYAYGDKDQYGNNVTIESGDGMDYIVNIGYNVMISAGDGKDTIDNLRSTVTIDAGDGNDYIWNRSDNVSINAGTGNDTISNMIASAVNIDAGEGADVIKLDDNSYSKARSGNNTISGGTGNDTIYMNSATTVGNVFVYNSGDGSDQIYNATKYDTISICGASYTRSTIDSNLVLDVTNSGVITLFGAANTAVNIEGTLVSESSETESDTNTISVFVSLDTETSVTLLKELNALGDDITVEKNGNYDNELEKALMSSANGIIRLITKLFKEDTKYKHDSNGNIVKDANGKPVKNDSTDTALANAGFGAISNLNSILNSVYKIADGKVKGADLITEIGTISTNVAGVVNNLAQLKKKNPNTTLIPSIASYAIGLTTNIIAVAADGASKNEISGIITNSTQLLGETITLLSKSKTLKDFFANTTLGKNLTGITGKANVIVTLGLGIFSAYNQYMESTEECELDGVLASTAAKEKWFDTACDAFHSLINYFTLGLGDFVFEQAYGAIATSIANVSYGLQYIATLIKGGDTSSIEYKKANTNVNLGMFSDALKAIFLHQITGTSNGDKIRNSTEKIIRSGAGDDDILNLNSNVEIYAGDGTDTVYCGDNSNGNYIDGGADNDKIAFYGTSNTVHGSAGNDIIAAFNDGKTPTSGNEIFGESGNDYIVIADEGLAARKSNNTVSGGADKDIISIENTTNPVVIQYATGDGDDVVYGYSSNDTIQITKGDYVTAASGQDIIITVGTSKITLVGAQGQKLNILKEAVKVEGITEKNGTLTLSKTFRGKTLDLADYAASVTKVNASALTAEYPVNVTGNSAGNSIKGGKGGDTISGETGDDTLYGGAGNDSIFGGAGKDKLYGEAGNDTLYAGAGNNTLTGGAGKDVFVYEGGSDVIADYKAGDDKIKLANASITSSSLSGSNIVLKTSAGNITVKGGKDKNITVIDKNNSETTQIYGRMNYSANQTAVTLASTFTGTLNTSEYASTVKRIDASSTSKAIRIYGNAQANTILGGNGGDTVYGAAGNDSILGNKGKDKLFGDAGNDILIGGLGNDTLTGGAGNDVFVYSNGDGADVIADFTAGADKISLASGSISSVSLKSSDMVFKIGSGSLTVKNGKDKEISIGSAIYYNNLIYNSKKTTVTLGGSFNGSLKAGDYDSKTKTINAASTAKAVNITGNSQANSILGGKGVDTLSGGTGSDTLTGGSGKDVFVYSDGDGKDVITDYTAGQDKVKIASGSISKTSYAGNNVVFTIGSGTLTIQNGKGKKITITDANNKTTTQTYSSAVSGSSALWFADDDNFTTSAPELDSILHVNSCEYATEKALSSTEPLTQINFQDSISSVAYIPSQATR